MTSSTNPQPWQDQDGVASYGSVLHGQIVADGRDPHSINPDRYRAVFVNGQRAGDATNVGDLWLVQTGWRDDHIRAGRTLRDALEATFPPSRR